MTIQKVNAKMTDSAVKILGALMDTQRLDHDYRQLTIVDRYTRLLETVYRIQSDDLLRSDYGASDLRLIAAYLYDCRIRAEYNRLHSKI